MKIPGAVRHPHAGIIKSASSVIATCVVVSSILALHAAQVHAGNPAIPAFIEIPQNLGTQWGGDMGEADVQRIGGELGVKWLRIEAGWATVEPKQGEYNFAGLEKHVDLLVRHGLKPLIILDYGNPIYQKTADPADDAFTGPSTPEAREGYARFSEAAAKHLAGKFPDINIVYEIWNEPDYQLFWRPKPDVAAYVELVKATASRIRAAAPGAAVIGPATMSAKTPFITRAIELGILDHLDGFSVHPYRRTGPNGKGSPETVIADYQKIRDLMSVWFAARGQPGKTLPLIESEWGYSETSLPDGAGVTPVQQAEYLTRTWLIQSWLDVRISIWFQWKSGDSPTDVWSHFGMLRVDGSDRPSLQAAKTLVGTLKGYRFVERVDMKDETTYVLKFASQEKEDAIYAGWMANGEAVVEIPSLPACLTVSMMGENGRVDPDKGVLSVKLGSSPIYLIPIISKD